MNRYQQKKLDAGAEVVVVLGLGLGAVVAVAAGIAGNPGSVTDALNTCCDAVITIVTISKIL